MFAGPRQSTLSRVIGNSRPRLPVVRRVRVRYHRALVRHRARRGHGRNRYAGGNRSVDKTVPDTGESGSYACAGGGKHQARCMIQCGNKVNVGGGLLPIAVDQPTYAWTETPPSGASPPPTFGSSMLAGPRQSTLSRVIGNSRPRLPVVRRVRIRYHRALVRHRARRGHGRNRYAGGNRSVDKTVPDTGESGSYACAGGGKHQARCVIQCGNKVNVGGGLLPIAVDQPTYAWTETPPSGASPLPRLDLQCLLDRVRAPYPG